MRTYRRATLAACLIVPAMTVAAAAERDRDRDDHWRGDIHRFHEYDFDRWRGGRWFHGPHGGRDGWWWVLGGEWYFYPQPIYPYPDPYVPPAVAMPAPAPGAAPAPQTWYYCANPQGYYPYVSQCPQPWQAVPAMPR